MTELATLARPVTPGDRQLTAAVLVVAALAWVLVALLPGLHPASHRALDATGLGPASAHPGHGGHRRAHDGHSTPERAPASPDPTSPDPTSPDPTSPDPTSPDPSRTGPASTHPTPTSPLRSMAGWVVMVLAMMLPPALPLLRVTRRLVVRRRHPRLLVVAAALAFVSVWLATGVLFALGDGLLRLATRRIDVMTQHPALISGLAAVAAGAYQFSRFKQACLTACRSPLALAMTSWTGIRSAGWETARLGARFGLVCVGCCWALMLLTFTVGAAAMPVMVVVGVVMALERLLPRIRPLVPLVGVQVVVLGVLILAGLVPPGLGT